MNEEKLKILKQSMEEEQKINEELKQKQEMFEEENKNLFESRNKLRETISECKAVLKENAEVGYLKDGLKSRMGGIGIRVSIIPVYDEKQALQWAKEKNLFLQLDSRAFEKVAKTGEIEFVKLEEKITVTFPKQIKITEETK